MERRVYKVLLPESIVVPLSGRDERSKAELDAYVDKALQEGTARLPLDLELMSWILLALERQKKLRQSLSALTGQRKMVKEFLLPKLQSQAYHTSRDFGLVKAT